MSPRRTNRNLDEVVITGHPVEVRPDGQGGGRLEGGLRLLQELTFDVDDPGLGFLLTLTLRAERRRLVCGEVLVRQRKGGRPVTGSALRDLPLEAYANEVRRQLLAHGQNSLFLVEEVQRSADAVAFEPARIETLRRQAAAEPGRPPLSQSLPEVAHLYRAAMANPDEQHAPTAAVARWLACSRGHAGRLVREARKQKMLGPGQVGVPGEAGPVTGDENEEGEGA